ncbi:unnamed protein product [Pleuronectes platessa]|uniref:Uncharacterized protein n=1 Tax=Pleuronectes platessa TaxID=8262 RepID=A0A9N7YXG5_PLEPL|nr:unnamed protein product [Pleuronectes platessa]
MLEELLNTLIGKKKKPLQRDKADWLNGPELDGDNRNEAKISQIQIRPFWLLPMFMTYTANSLQGAIEMLPCVPVSSGPGCCQRLFVSTRPLGHMSHTRWATVKPLVLRSRCYVTELEQHLSSPLCESQAQGAALWLMGSPTAHRVNVSGHLKCRRPEQRQREELRRFYLCPGSAAESEMTCITFCFLT